MPIAAVGLVVAGHRAHSSSTPCACDPTLAETALGLDAEQGLRDRLSSALELAIQRPDLATEAAERPAGR